MEGEENSWLLTESCKIGFILLVESQFCSNGIPLYQLAIINSDAVYLLIYSLHTCQLCLYSKDTDFAT